LRRSCKPSRFRISPARSGDSDFSAAETVAATAADRFVTSLAGALAAIEAALSHRHRPAAEKPPDGRGLKALSAP